MTSYEYTVPPEDAGGRLDTVLGRHPEMGSRSRVAGLIQSGAVTVDAVARAKSYLLAEGQTISVEVAVEVPLTLEPENLEVAVPYEDEWLLVADKPAGMAVHPSPGHSSGTLVHASARVTAWPVGRGFGLEWCIVSTRTPAVCWWWQSRRRCTGAWWR